MLDKFLPSRLVFIHKIPFTLYFKVIWMKKDDHFEHLAEIRSMMEKSSRFLSLSGISGVMAGIYAIAGGLIARHYIRNSQRYEWFIQAYIRPYTDAGREYAPKYSSELTFLVILGLVVMVLAISTGFLLTLRRARKSNQNIWNKVGLRMIVNMAIPLGIGGAFCGIMLWHGFIGFIAPATLIFYGLALVNGGKYTLDAIRHLGIAEALLGLICAVDLGNALLYWMIGFGVLHILYGARMWWKHERQ